MKDRLFWRLLSVTVMLGLLISLIGCGGRGATATESAAAQGTSPGSYEASRSETGGDPAEGLSGGRKLITTADLNLDVTDFASAVDCSWDSGNFRICGVSVPLSSSPFMA